MGEGWREESPGKDSIPGPCPLPPGKGVLQEQVFPKGGVSSVGRGPRAAPHALGWGWLLGPAGSPHPASLEGVNPVPLSFRTNTTMLLMKSSRPSGECGTCRGGRGLTGWATTQATPPVLSGLTVCPLAPLCLAWLSR